MRSTNDEKEPSRSLHPFTVIPAQLAGGGQDLHPDADFTFPEAPAFANPNGTPEGGTEIPDNKRIAQLSIGFGLVTASGMSAIASFQRASTVFITSIALLGLLAGAGFVYLVVKAILSAEYDFEL